VLPDISSHLEASGMAMIGAPFAREWRTTAGRRAVGPYWEVDVDDPSTVPADEVRTELFEPLAP
jgi:hypothetical protein